MAPTTTRTRLADQEKMKICEEKKKPGFSIEKIMKDYSISRTGVYKNDILYNKWLGKMVLTPFLST